jgi:hypothetical protein
MNKFGLATDFLIKDLYAAFGFFQTSFKDLFKTSQKLNDLSATLSFFNIKEL